MSDEKQKMAWRYAAQQHDANLTMSIEKLSEYPDWKSAFSRREEIKNDLTGSGTAEDPLGTSVEASESGRVGREMLLRQAVIMSLESGEPKCVEVTLTGADKPTILKVDGKQRSLVHVSGPEKSGETEVTWERYADYLGLKKSENKPNHQRGGLWESWQGNVWKGPRPLEIDSMIGAIRLAKKVIDTRDMLILRETINRYLPQDDFEKILKYAWTGDYQGMGDDELEAVLREKPQRVANVDDDLKLSDDQIQQILAAKEIGEKYHPSITQIDDHLGLKYQKVGQSEIDSLLDLFDKQNG